MKIDVHRDEVYCDTGSVGNLIASPYLMIMKVNADFDQVVALHSDRMEWVASPMVGVERRMLDRIGGEVARATSIVRYAPGSHFAEHTHNGGEEFIVLEGVFQDEHGDYPAGTYVRNPIGTHHVPRSESGCTIFVKLWQFDADDREQFAVDLNALELSDSSGTSGLARSVISERPNELVAIEEWDGEVARLIGSDGGAEVLVLSGSVTFNGDTFGKHGWIRIPSGEDQQIVSGAHGARVWIKTKHLKSVSAPVG